ncbi:MAG TPA: hypothetical protein VLH79_15780 [Chthonomonadales bacterium]|nr:hypothetical protein [Chthonomonadales bacterium]
MPEHPHAVQVDFAVEQGRIRPLHGANNGPRCLGGLMDLSPAFRELGFPALRLHDCEWPADAYVDTHVVFPDFGADPDDPASYDFRLTDGYMKAIVDLEMGIVYRLGCRIEHTEHRRHAHPPADFEKWARICVGILRHMNEGWANGHRWGIRHWEIWNEPDIPPGCWSGTWEDYHRLYVTAAKAIKAHDPNALVGGPAYSYATEKHDFVEGFLQRCREEGAPLDFFTWHTYAGRDLGIWERRAAAMREVLDRHGYREVPSHLNEWNCCPDGDWSNWPVFARGLTGPRGASGVAATLALLQDLPVDEAFLYTADTLVYGLFSREGEKQKNWYAMRAFRRLLDTPLRVRATGSTGALGIGALAGMAEDRRSAQVLLANYVVSPVKQMRLFLSEPPWPGQTEARVLLLDAAHNLEEVDARRLPAGAATFDLDVPNATVALVRLAPAAAT